MHHWGVKNFPWKLFKVQTDRGTGMAVSPELFQDPAPQTDCVVGTLKRGNQGLTAEVGVSAYVFKRQGMSHSTSLQPDFLIPRQEAEMLVGLGCLASNTP